MNRGIENLDADLAAQQRYFEFRVPAYAKLLAEVRTIAQSDAVFCDALADAWRDRVFGEFYARPLLILAALRSEVLRTGRSHPLAAALDEQKPDADAITHAAVLVSLSRPQRQFWELIAKRHVQTNETTRAVVWMWPAHMAGCRSGGRPLALVDLGASAGLNLIADALPRPWTQADGSELSVAVNPTITDRLAIDLRPLNVVDDDDAAWLRACVWPGQRRRLRRLHLAIDAWRLQSQSSHPPRQRAANLGDIGSVLRFERTRWSDATFVLLYHSAVRGYLPEQVEANFAAGVDSFLLRRPPGSAAWIGLETGDPKKGAMPAALRARVRDGQRIVEFVVARCEYHPIVIDVDDVAAAQFTAAVGRQIG